MFHRHVRPEVPVATPPRAPVAVILKPSPAPAGAVGFLVHAA